MTTREFLHILAAIIILTVVFGFGFVIMGDFEMLGYILFFSVLIVFVSVFSKKAMAYFLDSSVEHELWHLERFGFHKGSHFKKPVPAGIIFPLLISLLSAGLIKFSSVLTFDTNALKHRAAKRFGYYSYTEMTDWHVALIGASGIAGIMLLSIGSYFVPLVGFEALSKFAIYYAFWNLIPVGNLDGAKIFFGSRILWTTFALVVAIASLVAIVIL